MQNICLISFLFNAFNSLGNDNNRSNIILWNFRLKFKLITMSGYELIDPSLYILHWKYFIVSFNLAALVWLMA